MLRSPALVAVALLGALGTLPTLAAAGPRPYTGSFRACPEVDGAPAGSMDDTREIPACPENVAKVYREAFEAGEPVIELVTMGVGDLIWERHGHIALCVRFADPRGQRARARQAAATRPRNDAEWFQALLDAKVDVCSNYGIGNFQEPIGMAWGFFRGTNSFWAGPQTTEQLEHIYIGRDRTVWAQPIPLDAEPRKQVIASLSRDVREENKYYAYDHFWDNCTTRVRDILDEATDHALSKMPGDGDDRTYRDLAREGFYGMRLPLLVTDIAMGRVTDRVPTYYERMFLPQYLREAVEKRWGMTPAVLYQRQGPPPPEDGPSGRVLFALFALAVTAPAWLARWFGRYQRAGLAFAVVPPALLGLVLWFLAIISPLPYVAWNESCLIFFPFDVLLLLLSPVRRKLYARGRVAMLALVGLLQLVGVLTQPLLAPLLWPLVPALVVGFWPEHWTRAKAARPAPERAAG